MGEPPLWPGRDGLIKVLVAEIATLLLISVMALRIVHTETI